MVRCLTMSFVQVCFIGIIFIWEGFWAMEVEAMSLSAEEGAELEIKCSHSNAHGNVKYFCRNPCHDENVLITSKQKDNSKFSLRDAGNTFYVTISDLSLDDSGIYQCRVERVGIDTYNEVYITVTPKLAESQPNASLLNKASQKRLLYSGVGLGALLLILSTAVVIFIKHRHQHVNNPMGNDVTYTDPFKHTQKPSQETTSCLSANQSSELNPLTSELNRDITNKPTSDIYVNVQYDELCYSPVLFSETRVNSAQSETTPAESTVYSEVKT